jgi:hypothetical protein
MPKASLSPFCPCFAIIQHFLCATAQVRPKKAHAILFYSQNPSGQHDRNSLHGGCPVLAGTKWAANLWIWNKVSGPSEQGFRS